MPATLEQSEDIKITIFDPATRYIDSKKFTITYQMFSAPAKEDAFKHSLYQNSAFLKINYFIKNVLDGSLAFTLDQMDELAKYLAEYDNNFMVLPDLDDVTIMETLHRKFSAIVGEYSVISELSLYDHELNLKYNFYYDEDCVYSLPEQEEWTGELGFWDTPWWDRYDILTFDNIAKSVEERDAHVADKETRQSTVEPFDEIDGDILELLKKVKETVEGESDEVPKGELISLDNARQKKTGWKPTVV